MKASKNNIVKEPLKDPAAYDTIILRYGEIGLKGGNRFIFERKLESNISYALSREGIDFKLRRIRGRLFLGTKQIGESLPVLKRIFGLVSASPAVKAGLNEEEMKERMIMHLQHLSFDTFRVTVQRLNKSFELNSQELQRSLGAEVAIKLGKKVSLKEFDTNVQVEISDSAYIFTEKVLCNGGLPLGIEGKALALIDDEKSLLAAWLCMKRGCAVIPISFEDKDISLLQKYYNKEGLILIKDIQDIDSLSRSFRAKALILGQTLDDLKEININLPVLRPLIAYEEKEIQDKLNQIRG